MARVNRRRGRLKLGLARLCAAAACAAMVQTAASAAGPASMSESEADAEYQAMVKPALDFLTLVNRKFPGRECVRDRSHLNADYDAIALSIARTFLVRDDLRKDLREVAMRLATFQPLPADVRHLAIPLEVPPKTESAKAVNAMVVQTRIGLWKKLDELEAKYPSAAAAAAGDKIGLIMTTSDRGWRPDKPTDFFPERDNCGPR